MTDGMETGLVACLAILIALMLRGMAAERPPSRLVNLLAALLGAAALLLRVEFGYLFAVGAAALWLRALAEKEEGTSWLGASVTPVVRCLPFAVGGLAAGAHYSASKAGVICFTKSLALQAAPFKINVNAVSGGFIDTDALKSFPNYDEMLREVIRRTPFGRVG